jgi:hypothetical protein
MSLSRKKKSWNANGIEVECWWGARAPEFSLFFSLLTGIHQSVIRGGPRTVYCMKQPLGHGF